MPHHFISTETGEPFTHCCSCECLLADTSMHIVNKSYAANECVFELAMCLDCREDLNSQLSEDSRVAMFDFMHDHANMEQRQKELGTDSEIDAYLASCLICKIDADKLTDYTLGGIFTDTELTKGPFPILICSNCEEKLQATISEETRNVWDKFIGSHFPGPPSELKLPPRGKPVFL